jgi:release factor glutamine methyltransferase
MKTINVLLHEGKETLKHETDTPDLDAALLLADILRVDRTRLLLDAVNSVPEGAEARYRQSLKRRLEGECVAYIVGYKEFWGLRFAVNPAVLVPRPDTEILAEAALQRAREAQRALDLCTGSGILAIVLKREYPSLSVNASDISKAALDVARANAESLNAGVYFIESDLFERVDGTFDLIVSNPPYIPTDAIPFLQPEVQKEPYLALNGGADGLDIIRKIIIGAKSRLNPNGSLFLEADSAQIPYIADFLRANEYQDMHVYKDLSCSDRVITGRFFG